MAGFPATGKHTFGVLGACIRRPLPAHKTMDAKRPVCPSEGTEHLPLAFPAATLRGYYSLGSGVYTIVSSTATSRGIRNRRITRGNIRNVDAVGNSTARKSTVVRISGAPTARNISAWAEGPGKVPQKTGGLKARNMRGSSDVPVLQTGGCIGMHIPSPAGWAGMLARRWRSRWQRGVVCRRGFGALGGSEA